MIRYEDSENLYISADSMIFIGKNIEGFDQGRDVWYFQDAHSYCEQGPLIGQSEYLLQELGNFPSPSRDHRWKEAEVANIYAIHEEDIHYLINCEQFSDALRKCFYRRIEMGMKA